MDSPVRENNMYFMIGKGNICQFFFILTWCLLYHLLINFKCRDSWGITLILSTSCMIWCYTILFIPLKMKLEDTTYTVRPLSFLDLHQEFNNESWWRAERKKRKYQPTHCELYIYTWKQSSSTCIWSIYLLFEPMIISMTIGLLSARKLLNQWIIVGKLRNICQKFPWICSVCLNHFWPYKTSG